MATPKKLAAYQVAKGGLIDQVDGVEQRAVGWQTWATKIDIRAYHQQIWRA